VDVSSGRSVGALLASGDIHDLFKMEDTLSGQLVPLLPQAVDSSIPTVTYGTPDQPYVPSTQAPAVVPDNSTPYVQSSPSYVPDYSYPYYSTPYYSNYGYPYYGYYYPPIYFGGGFYFGHGFHDHHDFHHWGGIGTPHGGGGFSGGFHGGGGGHH